MTALVSALDSALLNFVWQGVGAAVLLWFVLTALRRRSAIARYLAGCAALGLLAVAPMVMAWSAYARPLSSGDAPVSVVAVAAAVGQMHARFHWVELARAWMLPVWACGVLLLSIRMLWGCAKVASLKRQGAAAEPAVLAMVERLARRIRVTRPVRVLISKLADGPSVVGWIRPVLLLPVATLLGLSAEQLEAVLAHELAHIRRYDYLVNMAQMLMETLFFYHPAVWWISKRIREEREVCCDNIAVRTCGDPVCYARALATLERMRVMEPGLSFNGVLGAKDGPLRYRIERLLGTARREQAPSRLPGMVAICLGLACFAPVRNPVEAQAPLVLPTPAPPAAPVVEMQAPQVAPLRRPAVALQVAPAPQPQPVPPLAGPVRIEVTVDVTGTVADAKVIDGPLDQRRAALLTALNMRFAPSAAPSRKEVTVLANSVFEGEPGFLRGITPVMTLDEVRDAAAAATERIAKLKAQQAEASERGAAQLQVYIDSETIALENLKHVTAGPGLAGKTLREIRISGLDTEQQQLRDSLPIQAHSVLTDASMSAAIRTVKRLYPGAGAYFGLDGETVIFVVILPRPEPVLVR